MKLLSHEFICCLAFKLSFLDSSNQIFKMKKLLTLTFFTILFSFAAKAQDYNTGLGLRLGSPSGITIKHFLGDQSAIEGILGFYNHGFNITGLYEVHGNAFDVPSLNWFIGGGAHLGGYNNKYKDYYDSNTEFGVDGIIGLEYTLDDAPINFGIDWKPKINFVGNTGFYGGDIALSVRYAFK